MILLLGKRSDVFSFFVQCHNGLKKKVTEKYNCMQCKTVLFMYLLNIFMGARPNRGRLIVCKQEMMSTVYGLTQLSNH